ncbi:DUF6551 family protein [Sphingomonas sp. RB3P16]|uniref:DUF6551 family protein n=1 Tax=Parasphingomonas frigoris TaxID=3096163 RepID=UPI002FC8D103
MVGVAAKPLKVNPQLGRRPVLANCTIAELKIDPAYQRSIATGESQGLIRRIAVEWDWSLCQPLVVARRNDDSLWVIDGQHRLAAARARRDIYDLPCVIVASQGAREEAASFVALNQQRRPLAALDIFRAALAAGDMDALAIMQSIEHVGLSLAPHQNYVSWKPGMISNVNGVRAAWRQHGDGATRRALDILARGFNGQVLRYCGTMFAAIVAVCAQEGAALEVDLFVSVVGGGSQEDWLRDFARGFAANENQSRPAAAANVMLAAYREAHAEAGDE